MTEPRVRLIDEPSVGLAPMVVDQVLDTIKMLQAKRKLTRSWPSRAPSTRPRLRTGPSSWPRAHRQ
jgi:hypothetical protein